MFCLGSTQFSILKKKKRISLCGTWYFPVKRSTPVYYQLWHFVSPRVALIPASLYSTSDASDI